MINFLYTNIGRGHPFYLDGIVEALNRCGQTECKTYDVFEISKDPALSAWRMARWLYKIGSTDSVIGKWYNSMRYKTDLNQDSFALRVMGTDLRKVFLDDETPLLVDHPVLVGILNGKKNLLYQHGELAVPKQALVKGADFVFVPLKESAAAFIECGYKSDQVAATGLCIEPRLVEQSGAAFHNRLIRYQGSAPLTGALFSSGAEPKPHVEKLIEAAIAVAKSGGIVIAVVQKRGKLFRRLSRITAKQAGSIELYTFDSREELDRITAEHFERFDYLVAPSHERSNWAVGVGLPMFILEPAIGPFAPLNRQILLDSNVALSVDCRTAEEFPWALDYYRKEGKLAQMAHAGWKRHNVNGFQTIAEFLINKYAAFS